MLQKVPVNNFERIKVTSQFNEDLIKNFNEERDDGYFLKVDVQYLEKLHGLYNELPFLPKRMKIVVVVNLHDNTEYVIHIRKLKQA